MSLEVNQNKEVLLKILLKDYEYHILGIGIRESAELTNEVKLEAHFRVNIHDEDSFEKFLLDFSKCSGTSKNKKNQVDRIGKKTKLYGVRKCIQTVLKKRMKLKITRIRMTTKQE